MALYIFLNTQNITIAQQRTCEGMFNVSEAKQNCTPCFTPAKLEPEVPWHLVRV